MAPLCPKTRVMRARVRVSVTGSYPREHKSCSSKQQSCLFILPGPSLVHTPSIQYPYPVRMGRQKLEHKKSTPSHQFPGT